MPFAGYQNKQGLDIHEYLGPAEHHQTKATLKKGFDEQPGAHVERRESATTDAVLNVSVDPITGKVAVTQTDDAAIWDGLAIDSEPALATGGAAWEHNLLHGGDRVEINDANLYATIAAKDLRHDLETLRGLKAGLPAGIDLSKVKVWATWDDSAPPVISASLNVKSITRAATGDYTVTFGVPFKSNNYGRVASAAGAGVDANIDTGAGTDRFQVNVEARSADTAFGLTTPNLMSFMATGELENE